MTSQELLQKRMNLWTQLKQINERQDDKGNLTSDDQTQWQRLNDEIDNLTKAIERTKQVEQIEAQEAEARAKVETPKAKKAEVSRAEAFDKWMRRMELSSEERSILARGTDTQTTTANEHGGYLVPSEWAPSIEKVMAQYSGMLQASRVIRTNSGGPLYFPVVDETAVMGAKIGEGVADSVSDVTWSQKELNAYTYTSNVIKVSYELEQDNAYPLAQHLQEIMAERLGRILNQEATVGDGTGDPNGVMTASSAGKVASATNAITRDEILDLIHSVDRVYRGTPNSYLMLHDTTLAAIKKLTVGTSDDRPLWQPSIRDGEPDRIEGIPYIVNNDIAELTDGVSSRVMAYGDFSKYVIRMSRDIEVKRLIERYADERVTGWFAFMRFDSELINTSAVKHLALAAS
jgi:HK97 family phage major capsid protein